jgi:hypothetical protein
MGFHSSVYKLNAEKGCRVRHVSSPKPRSIKFGIGETQDKFKIYVIKIWKFYLKRFSMSLTLNETLGVILYGTGCEITDTLLL